MNHADLPFPQVRTLPPPARSDDDDYGIVPIEAAVTTIRPTEKRETRECSEKCSQNPSDFC